MSERRPDPEKAARRGEDEPDVEGHKFRGPVEGEGVNPDPDDATEGEDGLRVR